MKEIGQVTLPPPAESVVRVPVTSGSPLVGIIRKCEIREGVYIAASLTRVVNGYAMTSILNTNDAEVRMQEPLVELDEFDPVWDRSRDSESEPRDREREIM
jgi:hypothetical protein